MKYSPNVDGAITITIEKMSPPYIRRPVRSFNVKKSMRTTVFMMETGIPRKS